MPINVRELQSSPLNQGNYKASLRKRKAQDNVAFELSLQSLQQVLEQSATNQHQIVREILWNLPNGVDDTSCWNDLTAPPAVDTTRPTVTVEAAFCVGLYDEITTTRGGYHQYSCLSSLGQSTLDRLQNEIVTSLLQVLDNNIKTKTTTARRWTVPYSLESWTEEKCRDWFGPTSMSTHSSSTNNNIMVESFWTLLENQTGKYFDRQLPKSFVMDYKVDTIANNTPMISTGKKKSPQQDWVDRLTIRPHTELGIITGPSFELDTIPVCRTLIQTLHHKLLRLGKKSVAIQCVDAEHLDAFESSRIELTCCGEQIVLASLHNYRDYCTGRVLRHGTTKESLNVTRLVIHTTRIMDWIMQCNVRNDRDDDTIRVPFDNQIGIFPMIRRIERGKSGRRIIHTIKNQTELEVAPQRSKNAAIPEAAALSYSFLPLYR